MNVVGLAAATDRDIYGGKASGLAAAVGAGLPVPDGIALSWQLVERIAGGDTAAVQLMLASVRDWRARSGHGRRPFSLAVRSSAVDEDAPEASWAGQLATVLNVTSDTGVLDAVRTIHRSAESASAQKYRRTLGLELRAPRTAVVVQEMVDPRSAGVMFTRDPMTGSDDRVIESAWGLGEAVVSGVVTPDRFRLAFSGQILDRRPAVKELAVRYAPDGLPGTVEATLTPVQARSLSLTDAQLRQLALLAEHCERHFGGPQDVEWAIADDSVVLLQSRRITRMAAGSTARDQEPPAAPQPDPSADGVPDRRSAMSGRRLTGLLLAAVLTPLNSTIVAVALPVVASDLDSTPADVTRWMVTSYLVVCILAQSPAGRAADRWGFGRILTLGRATFLVGALAAALAPSLAILAGGRVLMAAGGALTIPTVFAELSDGVAKERRGFVFGLFGAAMGAAAAVGPLIGGAVTAHFGWHAVFVVSVPIILVSLLLVPPTVAGPAARADRGEAVSPAGFDPVGTVLLAVAVLALVAAVERIGSDGLWYAVVAVTVGTGFVLRERRRGGAVLDVQLFRRRQFAAGTSIIALHNLVLYSMLLLLPFLLAASGAATLDTGATLLMFTAAMVLTAPLGGHVSDRIGPRIVAAGGSVLAAAGALVFAVSGGDVLAVPLVVMGAGVGLATGPSQAAALAAARTAQTGSAAGAMSTMRYLGGVVGSGLVALLAGGGFVDRSWLLIFPVVLLISAGAATWLPGPERARSRLA